MRISYNPEDKNVIYASLGDPEKEMFRSLHIKLGVIKNSVKVMDRDGEGFEDSTERFTQLSEAKMKDVIFTGPAIKKVVCDLDFESKLN